MWRNGKKITRRYFSYMDAVAWRHRERHLPDAPKLNLVRRLEIARRDLRDAAAALREHERRTKASA